MRAPLHRRTETIGACIADPFANGEGAEEIDTFTIPQRVQAAGVSTQPQVWRMTTRAVNQNNAGGAEPLIIDFEGSHG
jgi:hypothetical protein